MGENKIDLNNIHERELHPFLVIYLAKKMNIYTKTIFHEVSTKIGRGKSEWLHPDIVGFDLPVKNWSEKVLELCGNFTINRATLYSFELKKSITLDSLREQFFQAVSNSSWANEGYLVGVDIDTSNLELMKEINRLSSAFNIGIIKLNLLDVNSSEILVPARRKDKLDGETMNKLFDINKNFRKFVQIVLDSIKINQIVHNGLDKILSTDELKEIVDEIALKDTTKDDNVIVDKTNKILKEEANFQYISINSDFKGKSPRSIRICGDNLEASSWKQLHIEVCNYLINKDSNKFIKISNDIKGRKRPYFTKDENKLRVPYYLDTIKLYMEINLSANNIMSIIKKLLKGFSINENQIEIHIK